MKKFITSIALLAMFCAFTTQSATASIVTGTFGVGEGATIVFTTTGASGPIYLDMTSNGSTDVIGGNPADTELGLYLGTGAGATLVANDDDNGIGLSSVLTFGAGSGLMLGDPFNLGGDGIANGEFGNLAAGTYTLVIGEFNTTFGATLGATTFGNEAVDYRVEFFTNDAGFSIAPEPTSLMVWGMGLACFAGLKCRRKV